jgi:exonuclease VII small subunit
MAALDSLSTTLEDLGTASNQLEESVAILHRGIETHASQGLEVLARLEAAQSSLSAARNDGAMLRKTVKVLSELEDASRVITGCQDIPGLRRCVATVEEIGRRMLGGEPTEPVSAAACDGFSERVAACSGRHAEMWRDWLEGSADILFRGARALALQPPGGLSEGLDGLGAERAALEEAKLMLSLSERISGLSELVDSTRQRTSASQPVGVPPHQPATAMGFACQCYDAFRDNCSKRAVAEFQAAGRLAAGPRGADERAWLEALAEAAATASRASRALMAIFGLLPQRPSSNAFVEGAENATATGKELASATDALVGSLRDLPPSSSGAARVQAVRALASAMQAHLHTQIEAVPALVQAAQEHDSPARRVLSKLGEAQEKLAHEAIIQAQKCAT